MDDPREAVDAAERLEACELVLAEVLKGLPPERWWAPWRKGTRALVTAAMFPLAEFALGGIGLVVMSGWIGALAEWNALGQAAARNTERGEEISREEQVAIDAAKDEVDGYRARMERLVKQAHE